MELQIGIENFFLDYYEPLWTCLWTNSEIDENMASEKFAFNVTWSHPGCCIPSFGQKSTCPECWAVPKPMSFNVSASLWITSTKLASESSSLTGTVEPSKYGPAGSRPEIVIIVGLLTWIGEVGFR